MPIEKVGGKAPRNFNLDPSGRFSLAAAQNSDKINVFAIDQETGKLTPTKHRVKIPKPVCIRFAD
ncbi:MAG: beta-propeller fold lactonase family protein [Pseudomonadota bacterium]